MTRQETESSVGRTGYVLGLMRALKILQAHGHSVLSPVGEEICSAILNAKSEDIEAERLSLLGRAAEAPSVEGIA